MFTEAGLEGLSRGDNPRAPASRREAELEAKVEELTAALGEAYVELRLWRKRRALSGDEESDSRRRSRFDGSADGSGSRRRLGTTGEPRISPADSASASPDHSR